MPTKITTKTDESGMTTSVIKPTTSWQGLLGGFLLFAFGGFWTAIDALIALQNKQSPHWVHLLITGGFCLAGVVVAFAAVVLPRLGGLSVVVAPYIPKIFGNRAGDIQADGSVNQPPPPPPPIIQPPQS